MKACAHHKNYCPPAPHLRGARRWKNKRIGLLGGSFNPPHSGHMHIALAALRRYDFDAIWWLVSPQNPLKSKGNSFKNRLAMTRRFVQHPKMVVSDIETQMGISYSLQTIEKLQTYFPDTEFHWIAGMDNATLFHRWEGWQKLLNMIPFTFFNRPPLRMAVQKNAIHMYKSDKKRAGWILQGKTRNISSTALRKRKFGLFRRFKV